mmetsp:Transcript_21639/g.28789  ORF Transcript_21639/g.28789 Transcript_21639/m.28789 type:complete len:235 (-) Transcript_21639:318-1022(-)
MTTVGKKILIVSTSASEMEGHPTGLWLEELAAPYYTFVEAGYDVTIASVKGGPVPIDQNSVSEPFFTDDAKKFMHDGAAVGMLSHTKAVADLVGDVAESFDAVFLPGGHGTCADFVGDAAVALHKVVETMFAANKVVAAVCHGPMGLTGCVKGEEKLPLVKDLKVAAFTDSEEAAVGLTEKVPFLLESKLKEQGAIHESGDDWSEKVCVDGKLVTGQNPQSSKLCAEKVVELLG